MSNSPSDRSPVDDSIDPDKEARMLLNPPSDSVQFSSNSSRDPTNGQVLLSPVGSANSAIRSGVGMTKQELMKYANDPFWVNLRTFLFILFWVIWFAMLIGSIVIVAMAPGCPSTASLPWWKKSSTIQINIGHSDQASRSSYAAQMIDKVNEILSMIPELAEKNVNTLVVGDFDPYILANSDTDDNVTVQHIDKLRAQIISLAKNEKDIRLIVGLQVEQTPESFDWYNRSKFNQSGYEDAYIWTSQKPKLEPYKYDVDRLQYVVLDANTKNPLLNYASLNVQELIRDTILNWIKTKIKGIQTGPVYWLDATNENINKSKQAELDLLKAVKSAGQNKVLLIKEQELPAKIFDEDLAQEASFDMAPDSSYWNRLAKQVINKEVLAQVFEPYVTQEEQHISQNNKTQEDILVTRETVGKHWRTYQIPHPADPSNHLLKKSNLAMAEAATMIMFMIPRITPIIQISLSGESFDSLNNKSMVVDRMLRLRHENPETFLAGRTILPKVKGSDQVFAIYRAAKKEKGYLLLINISDQPQTVSLDSGELPYQEEMVSKRIILLNTDSSQQLIGTKVNLDQIKLDPKQTMLIEFSGQ